MTNITDGIFPEMLALKIEIGRKEKEPSVGAEDSQSILKGLYPEMRSLTIEIGHDLKLLQKLFRW